MNVIFLASRCVTIEIQNNTAFNSPDAFSVSLNGRIVLDGVRTNIFSLHDLLPDTDYTVGIPGKSINFRTSCESVSLDVREFHVIGDGKSDDTLAIQAAIMCCPRNGRVVIPAGIYLVRTLFLKSDIDIELAEGATLLGETDRNRYPVLPGRVQGTRAEFFFGTWEGCAESSFASLITGIGVENVKIYGKGIVNCNADHSDWWQKDLEKRLAWRPRGIFLNRCRNIALQGITCANTPSWNQHAFFCSGISYVDMKLVNPKQNPNTDGINPESCDTVKILGCQFSVGDDCIAIKSGKAEMGKLLHTPCQNIVVRNCCMAYGHGAVTLGSEMSAGLKNISVSKCLFRHTDRGLRIKSQRGRGSAAIVENVVFDNIIMDGVLTPLVINMFYKARIDSPDTEYKYNPLPQVVDARTPHLGHFTFRHIIATDAEYAFGAFWGLPEQPIDSITIEDSSFSMKNEAREGYPLMSLESRKCRKNGFLFMHVRKVEIKNVTTVGSLGDAFEFVAVDEKEINE